MTIDPVQVEDTGRYTCVATNEYGQATTSAVRGHAPKFDQSLVDQSLNAGDRVKIEAIVSALPEAAVYWYLDGRPIKETDGRFRLTSLAPAGIFGLEIISASSDMNGTLECHAENDFGEVVSKSKLTVLTPTPAPKIKFGLRDVTLTEDDTLKLQELKSNWNINVSKTDACTFSLEISKIAIEHSGPLKCVITNESGQDETLCHIYINQKTIPAPTVTKPLPKEVKVKEWENLQLEVEIDSDSQPNRITWFLSGKELKDDSMNVKINTAKDCSKSMLEISRISSDQSGKITCKIDNRCDSTFTDSDVTVQKRPTRRPSLKEQLPESVTVRVDEPLILNVSSSTNIYEEKVTWKINNRELGREESNIRVSNPIPGQYQLKVEKVGVEMDNYSITCKISNEIGTNESSTVIKIDRSKELEEEARKMREEEEKIRKEEEEKLKRTEEEEKRRREQEEQQRREEEEKRRIEEELERQRILEAEREKLKQMEEEQEKQKKYAEEQEKQRKLEEEKEKQRQFLEEQERQKRLADELEKQRKMEEEQRRLAEEQEKQRMATEQEKLRQKQEAAQKPEEMDYEVEITQFSKVETITTDQINPNFVRSLSDALISTNEIVTFQIQCSGKPAPEITWFLNGKLLQSGPGVKIESKPDGVDVLELSNLTPKDSGEVECHITNPLGEKVCKSKLVVVEPGQKTNGKPVFQVPLTSVNVAEGETLKAKVIVTGDQPRVKWYVNNQLVVKTDDVTMTSENNIFTLEIAGASPDMNGTMKCVAYNSRGEISCSAPITVTQGVPVEFEQYLSDTSCHEGDTLRLKAVLLGEPAPSVTWFINGKQLEESQNIKIFVERSTYMVVIKDITCDMSGEVLCKAVNEFGEASSSAYLHISPRGVPPDFTEWLSNLNVKEGSTVTHKVVFTGQPTPTIVWYINNREIKAKDENFKIETTIDTCTLTIKKFTPDLVGEIICKAENDAGEVSCTANMHLFSAK
uniref:Ig-like domain-containing protein n=1 Tax=Romanomermis culicivorax TaxID=13658 RepID=A0A915KBG1_ROMCU